MFSCLEAIGIIFHVDLALAVTQETFLEIYYHFFHLMANDNSQDVYMSIVFLVNECLQLFLVYLSITS